MDTAFDQAVELINQYPELQDFVGKRDSSLIDWAEKTLGVVFPPSYRRFLSEYGAGSFGSAEFYGVIDDILENSTVPDAVWLTLETRKYGLASNLVWIYGIEFEHYLVTGQNPNDEVSVVTWDFGTPRKADVPQMEVVAHSFGEFFLKIIEEQISWLKNEPNPNARRNRGTDVISDDFFKTAFEDE